MNIKLSTSRETLGIHSERKKNLTRFLLLQQNAKFKLKTKQPPKKRIPKKRL